jgi:FkbM family methyltransferase
MRHIAARINAWKRFLKGYYSFGVALQCMLPARFRSFTELELEIVICNQYHVELIKPDATVVDAGANVGVFSILAAQTHPDARILAFEPTPETFVKLVENTKGYKNIECFHVALGDENKMASIIEEKECETNHIGEGGTPVEMKTIDSLGIKMDFLKMDTEGCEARILKGAAETIKTNKPVIVMSAYHHPEDKEALPNILNGIAPYGCTLEFKVEEDFICMPQ